MRCYSSRHGAGPFVCEVLDDPEFELQFREEHNAHNKWQGSFRKGWLDLVPMEYAIRVCPLREQSLATDIWQVLGGVDQLCVTCLDLYTEKHAQVCTGYNYIGHEGLVNSTRLPLLD